MIPFQTNLERNPNSSYIILLDVNFENLIRRLHFLYVLNKHV